MIGFNMFQFPLRVDGVRIFGNVDSEPLLTACDEETAKRVAYCLTEYRKLDIGKRRTARDPIQLRA